MGESVASALQELSFLTCIKVFFPEPGGDGACRFSSGHQGVMGLPSGGLPTWGSR